MATTLLEYFNELRTQNPFSWVKDSEVTTVAVSYTHLAEFINTYDLEEGEYSIVACIPTEMTMASFDPHDFDVKERCV